METKTYKRLGLLTGAVVLIAVFFALDLQRYLTLSHLKESQEYLRELYAERPLTMIGAYFLLYVLVTGLSLPGAAVMTLAGAAVFGFGVGVLVVSFASTIGATLACFAARYLVGEIVQRKFSDSLDKVNRGVAREGAFYLFTMRLIPAVPFFVINLVMGLTRMPLRTFYWVSQVGMLPGTMVYVNAGRELGRLESLSDILSPSLIASFVLLGLFPLAAKRLIGYYRKKSGRKPV